MEALHFRVFCTISVLADHFCLCILLLEYSFSCIDDIISEHKVLYNKKIITLPPQLISFSFITAIPVQPVVPHLLRPGQRELLLLRCSSAGCGRVYPFTEDDLAICHPQWKAGAYYSRLCICASALEVIIVFVYHCLINSTAGEQMSLPYCSLLRKSH